MKDFHVKKIMKLFEKQNFDWAEMILLICDADEIKNPKTEVKIVYNKQHFADYYGVDKETFNKWIPIFCPNLWDGKYKSKRKFSDIEVIYIYKCLGRYSKNQDLPRNHKEISDLIHYEKKWKKSRKYQEFALELENKFPNEKIDFQVFPPSFVREILEEMIENFETDCSDELGSKFDRNLTNLKLLLKKHGAMSEREKYIRLRWMFRHFIEISD